MRRLSYLVYFIFLGEKRERYPAVRETAALRNQTPILTHLTGILDREIERERYREIYREIYIGR